jgi:hypothetical protein
MAQKATPTESHLLLHSDDQTQALDNMLVPPVRDSATTQVASALLSAPHLPCPQDIQEIESRARRLTQGVQASLPQSCVLPGTQISACQGHQAPVVDPDSPLRANEGASSPISSMPIPQKVFATLHETANRAIVPLMSASENLTDNTDEPWTLTAEDRRNLGLDIVDNNPVLEPLLSDAAWEGFRIPIPADDGRVPKGEATTSEPTDAPASGQGDHVAAAQNAYLGHVFLAGADEERLAQNFGGLHYEIDFEALLARQ